jgi:protocatechuate 3,4-dioxygenase beta subunit
MSKTNNNRRQFIRNASLAAFTVGLFPKSLLAKDQHEMQTLACDETTRDYYGVGPFYTENPPVKGDDQLANKTEAGERIIIRGRVTNLDCTEMIANAVIDVWHADDAGDYDNVGFNLRGKFTTNSQGFYSFETIKPGKYLNGSSYRPSHIHFKITPPGKATLVTQLYFKGDTDIPGDAAASITSGTFDASHRIVELKENNDGKLEGVWDIAVDGEGGNIGTQDLHLDKGVIYSAEPNPFSSRLEIKYGVFNESRVGISIYNLQGQLVAELEDKHLKPEKYSAVWEPASNVLPGQYFVALKLNDLQLQYLKVVKI